MILYIHAWYDKYRWESHFIAMLFQCSRCLAVHSIQPLMLMILKRVVYIWWLEIRINCFSLILNTNKYHLKTLDYPWNSFLASIHSFRLGVLNYHWGMGRVYIRLGCCEQNQPEMRSEGHVSRATQTSYDIFGSCAWVPATNCGHPSTWFIWYQYTTDYDTCWISIEMKLNWQLWLSNSVAQCCRVHPFYQSAVPRFQAGNHQYQAGDTQS